MRTPLRPFRVQKGGMTLTPGVVTALLRPGLTMLRPFGVRVCGNCDYRQSNNDMQPPTIMIPYNFTGTEKLIPVIIRIITGIFFRISRKFFLYYGFIPSSLRSFAVSRRVLRLWIVLVVAFRISGAAVCYFFCLNSYRTTSSWLSQLRWWES